MSTRKQTFPSVKAEGLEWIFVNKNQASDMEQLRRQYKYHVLDVQEVLPPLQRPKVVARDGYIFMILHYPLYDPDTRDILTTEVDFFITEHRLVTVNVDEVAPLKNMFDRCQRSAHRNVCLQGDMTHLLYTLLHEMTEHVFSMLVRMNNDLDTIETRMFEEYERHLIQELLRIKTNIADIRKAMQPHQTIIRNLMRVAPRHFPIHRLQDYFDDLEDDTREIWETLAVQKETADALHETNQSLIDFRINEIIKTLTIFSVIVFPLTLVAAIFGMNVEMPLVHHPYGFWVIIGIMAVGTGGMLGYFKSKRWL